MTKRLRTELRSLKPKRVLEVATGEGAFLSFVRQACPDTDLVVGVDVSTESIRKANDAHATESIVLALMQGEQLGFADNSFDLVCVSNSLHHFENPEVVLAEMKRVLRPEGTFVITEMFSDNQSKAQMTHVMIHHWWADIDTVEGKNHRRTFSRQELVGLACQLNLSDFDTYDLAASSARPSDTELVKVLEEKCDSYLDKIGRDSNYTQLVERGAQLRRRLREIGADWPTEVCIMGRKKTAMIENFEVP